MEQAAGRGHHLKNDNELSNGIRMRLLKYVRRTHKAKTPFKSINLFMKIRKQVDFYELRIKS